MPLITLLLSLLSCESKKMTTSCFANLDRGARPNGVILVAFFARDLQYHSSSDGSVRTSRNMFTPHTADDGRQHLESFP
uniref:Putative secreted protein n=1 Tax=Anopheles darlingi TaxID=43151 RepID=A0A2M4D6V5_ANODA